MQNCCTADDEVGAKSRDRARFSTHGLAYSGNVDILATEPRSRAASRQVQSQGQNRLRIWKKDRQIERGSRSRSCRVAASSAIHETIFDGRTLELYLPGADQTMQTYKLAVGSSKQLNGLYFRVVLGSGFGEQ